MTVGITAQEYHERRAKLAASLPENGIAILPSADLKYRSGAVFYQFYQESNFLYLTGFLEPESVAIIQKVGAGNSDEYLFHLLVREKDVKAEQWEGARSGTQAAVDVFNADQSGDIKEMAALLPPLIAQATGGVYTDAAADSRTNFSKFFGATQSSDGFLSLLRDADVKALRPLMNDLKIIKSPAEISNMRHAGRISGRAYANAMRRQWSDEKALGSYLDYQFQQNGCTGSAYVPVVAGGKNANCIHYVRNDMEINQDEIVLVDAGAEYGHYITDITRSWPINGQFSAAQKDLYEVVLNAQRASVSLCKEDSGLSLDQIHSATEKALREGLKDIGFDISGNEMDILFPHHVGHYIGMDVHDTPGYRRNVPLKAGMCVTVEPGIYVPDDDRFPSHFRNMGIRIEDSIAVEETTPHILTTEAPKEVADIEALGREMKEKKH